ncbi:MAG: 2-oxoacid:acceptor oxidoreductase family protein, partial [Phycisphaerae bacterium]
MSITIRIAGEAGQGVLTTGGLLVSALAEAGLNVLATRSYMSRIRGGLNWYDVRVGEAPLHAAARQADLLVAFTDAAMETLRGDVVDGGLILYNGARAEGAVAIDLTGVAKEVGGSALYSNTVATGAVFALLGYDLDELEAVLKKQFAKKGDEVAAANQACARKGAELAAVGTGRLRGPKPAGKAGCV